MAPSAAGGSRKGLLARCFGGKDGGGHRDFDHDVIAHHGSAAPSLGELQQKVAEQGRELASLRAELKHSHAPAPVMELDQLTKRVQDLAQRVAEQSAQRDAAEANGAAPTHRNDAEGALGSNQTQRSSSQGGPGGVPMPSVSMASEPSQVSIKLAPSDPDSPAPSGSVEQAIANVSSAGAGAAAEGPGDLMTREQVEWLVAEYLRQDRETFEETLEQKMEWATQGATRAERDTDAWKEDVRHVVRKEMDSQASVAVEGSARGVGCLNKADVHDMFQRMRAEFVREQESRFSDLERVLRGEMELLAAAAAGERAAGFAGQVQEIAERAVESALMGEDAGDNGKNGQTGQGRVGGNGRRGAGRHVRGVSVGEVERIASEVLEREKTSMMLTVARSVSRSAGLVINKRTEDLKGRVHSGATEATVEDLRRQIRALQARLATLESTNAASTHNATTPAPAPTPTALPSNGGPQHHPERDLSSDPGLTHRTSIPASAAVTAHSEGGCFRELAPAAGSVGSGSMSEGGRGEYSLREAEGAGFGAELESRDGRDEENRDDRVVDGDGVSGRAPLTLSPSVGSSSVDVPLGLGNEGNEGGDDVESPHIRGTRDGEVGEGKGGGVEGEGGVGSRQGSAALGGTLAGWAEGGAE